MIERPAAIARIDAAFTVHPAVALVGPRQCGKTTLARMYAKKKADVTFFDLERAMDQRRLEAPEQALSPLGGLVVIDEVQRAPSLFETLRVLLDRSRARDSCCWAARLRGCSGIPRRRLRAGWG